MSRRVFQLSLPASDPASAIILAWLAQVPTGADVSPLMRQALVVGITLGPTLERIAARLDALEAQRGLVVEMEAADPTIVATLLDFAHLE